LHRREGDVGAQRIFHLRGAVFEPREQIAMPPLEILENVG
jgi:hypothetical protein